jgi:hypothetical protein
MATPGGKTRGVHRVSFELANGPIPAGKRVCHRCDNPPCCNPEHLFCGTGRENTRDAALKGRLRRKLTEEQRSQVVALHRSGISKGELSRNFGITHRSITQILDAAAWRTIERKPQIVVPDAVNRGQKRIPSILSR